MARWLMILAAVLALGVAEARAEGDAYQFGFASIDGQPLPLSTFRGKVLLIVNTASLCGFTPQYAGLKSLYDRYRDRGFVVLGVPSNDFGSQEPGSAGDIKSFCQTRFDIDFPLTEKAHVVGPEAHPFYRWASQTLGEAKRPRWNFHKYLVGPDGALTASFSTAIEPTDSEITTAIEKLLRHAAS